MPSDLFRLPAPDRSPQHRGEQLAPEADAQDGLPGTERFFDESHLVPEKRVTRFLVDGHRSAHDDEASGTTGIYGNLFAFKRPDHFEREPRSTKRAHDGSWRFAHGVLKNTDGAHGKAPATGASNPAERAQVSLPGCRQAAIDRWCGHPPSAPRPCESRPPGRRRCN